VLQAQIDKLTAEKKKKDEEAATAVAAPQV